MLKKILNHELSRGCRDLDDILPSSIYATIAGVKDNAIESYLRQTSFYDPDNRRWNLPCDSSPKQPFLELKNLYEPFKNIISSIIQYFNIDSVAVEDTHKTYMIHLEDYLEVYVDEKDNEVQLKTAPDLCIMGKGKMFRPAANGTCPSYFHCAAPVEIKTTRLMKNVSFKDVTLQVAAYVRQAFTHQPNRFFTCAIIATEEHFHLLVFDRAGTIRTTHFNLHDEAATFVRVIIGISSINSRQLSSFDQDITYLGNDSDYVHLNIRDYIPVHGRSVKRRSYSILLNGKPFVRKAIRGRGTRCWLGTIVPGEIRVIVKDSWRSKDRRPEWKLLLKAAGLDGVGQMMAYTDKEGTSVSELRSKIIQNFSFAPGEVDRIFTRVILEAYGPAIHYFQTPLQILYTFRDAVAGHRALWMNNILHRDVSLHNVLIGKEDAQAGNRGILIDLDMAIDITTYVPSEDPRTGTKAFQSIMTLRPDAYMVPQDHRDDLESFYYVLLWICSLFVAPRRLISHAVLQDLESPDDNTCADFKAALLVGVHRVIGPWFVKTVFATLLKALGKILHEWVMSKNDTISIYLDTKSKGDNITPSLFPSITETRAKVGSRDHDLFLQEIDNAIQVLLNDENDFGRSQGHGVDLAHGQETIELQLETDDNQATATCNNINTAKRGRSHNSDKESDDSTKRARLEDVAHLMK